MAVSKRLRFEILRRDSHTCQYCGEAAPNVTLHVDHVRPKALGGTDGPDNLVAACKDCNSGKASTIMESEHAQEISSRNLNWELQAQELSAKLRGTLERDQQYVEDFESEWAGSAESAGNPPVWPTGYRASVYRWAGLGYPMECLELAVGVAQASRHVADEDRFSYLAGIIWKQIKEAHVELEEVETVRLFTNEEYFDAYEKGCEWGQKEGYRQGAYDAPMLYAYWNPLTFVVDGLSGKKIENMRWVPDGANS